MNHDEFQYVLDMAMENYGVAILEDKQGAYIYCGHYGLCEPERFDDVDSALKAFKNEEGKVPNTIQVDDIPIVKDTESYELIHFIYKIGE